MNNLDFNDFKYIDLTDLKKKYHINLKLDLQGFQEELSKSKAVFVEPEVGLIANDMFLHERLDGKTDYDLFYTQSRFVAISK